MPRTLAPWERVERSIQTRYRKEIWTPFTTAVKEYRLLPAGCRVAVPVRGEQRFALLAVLLRMLERYSSIPITVRFFRADDSGAAERLGLPLTEAADCDRLAGPECFSDATETLFGSLLEEDVLRGVPPAERQGERLLVRPLLLIPRDRIAAWDRSNGLALDPPPVRQRTRALLDELKRRHPNAEISIYRSAQNVWPDTFPGWRKDGKAVPFSDIYDRKGN